LGSCKQQIVFCCLSRLRFEMVLYFTAKDGTMLYMGRDKYENEDLIKYAWPEDIWYATVAQQNIIE